MRARASPTLPPHSRPTAPITAAAHEPGLISPLLRPGDRTSELQTAPPSHLPQPRAAFLIRSASKRSRGRPLPRHAATALSHLWPRRSGNYQSHQDTHWRPGRILCVHPYQLRTPCRADSEELSVPRVLAWDMTADCPKGRPYLEVPALTPLIRLRSDLAKQLRPDTLWTCAGQSAWR